MSRHGYSDDYDDQWAVIRWRGAVASSIKGKRGQTLLKDLLIALDQMPTKRLIAHELKTTQGEVCALGALGVKRQMKSLEIIDPDDYEIVASEFGVAEPLIREIVYKNDEACEHKTPEERWHYMMNWVSGQIRNKPCSVE